MTLARIEGWSQSELDDALADVAGGMDLTDDWNVHKGNLAYGVVISRNDEAARKVAGFPEFGDVVLWRRVRGKDCAAIEKLTRENGPDTKGQVCNADGSRRITIHGAAKPVILNWGDDIIGVVAKWNEHASAVNG